MRLQSFILLIILFFTAYITTYAQGTVVDRSVPKDSVISKEITTPAEPLQVNDLKAGFKDLFVSNKTSEGLDVTTLNPRAISFVQDYMDKHKKKLTEMKGWGKPYFDMMDAILTQHGVPREMKYLAVIESHLKSYAVSWAGAVGPWQFMPATGRRMGLKVNYNMDERTNYFKSTHAAARYLTELYSTYGDWLLVIAAYNGGPGNVDAAIRRSKSKDFWTLQNYLPTESKNHVKKFIATHYIMEGQGGITTVTKREASELRITAANKSTNELTSEEIKNSKTDSVSGRYNSVVLVSKIGMDILTFNRYNPGFDKTLAAGSKFELRLPADKMNLFNVKKSEILVESTMLLMNSVGDGKKAF
jgi:membrane-bound lytic murein transglycosylase D